MQNVKSIEYYINEIEIVEHDYRKCLISYRYTLDDEGDILYEIIENEEFAEMLQELGYIDSYYNSVNGIMVRYEQVENEGTQYQDYKMYNQLLEDYEIDISYEDTVKILAISLHNKEIKKHAKIVADKVISLFTDSCKIIN